MKNTILSSNISTQHNCKKTHNANHLMKNILNKNSLKQDFYKQSKKTFNLIVVKHTLTKGIGPFLLF